MNIIFICLFRRATICLLNPGMSVILSYKDHKIYIVSVRPMARASLHNYGQGLRLGCAIVRTRASPSTETIPVMI